MKHNFEERRQNRIEYAKKQAAKNEQLSDELYNQATKMSSAIPFGQPILVGHHSEKRDRNYRDKIHNKLGQAFEASDKAKYYERKAEAIESNDAIFSDDPGALEKLRAQIIRLEANQSFMKEANRFIRKKDEEGFLNMELGTPELWKELNTPDYMGRVGFASYAFSNNGTNIRRIKQRIQQLELLESRPASEVPFPGGIVKENKEAGRVQFLFDEKPSEQIRKILKGNAFRWSPKEEAWQRHLNANGIFAAKVVLKKLLETQPGY